MKIGLLSNKTDTSLKWIIFEVDGVTHWITFRYSVFKGFTDVNFDGLKNVQVIDAYPPLSEVAKVSATILWDDLKMIISRKFRSSK